MDSEPAEIKTRRPSLSDSLAVLDLILACDNAAYGEPDYDLDSLLDEWSDITLDQDAWLAYSHSGELIGYASVSHFEQQFRVDVYTHPGLESNRLTTHLLELCEGRCREQLDPEAGEGSATLYIPHVFQRVRQVIEMRGYELLKYHFGMRIDIPEPPPEPAWPEGITLRNAVPGQDDELIYDFIQTAFDWPGRTPPTFERWRDLMMGASNFDPELWFLAYNDGELVGAVLCFDYPQYVWVRQLGVAPAWRRRGLGAALLQHVFGFFQRRGHKRVGLAVESNNPKAYEFYERVGMKRVQQYDEYRKTLTAS
jgi:ribosomal protein S18 acetylase RimI-like enzyme